MAYRYADHRRVLLTAWNAAELAGKIAAEEKENGWPSR